MYGTGIGNILNKRLFSVFAKGKKKLLMKDQDKSGLKRKLDRDEHRSLCSM